MLNIASSTSNSSLSHFKIEDVQPNAVDLRIARLWMLDPTSEFILFDNDKQHRQKIELFANPQTRMFELPARTTFEVQFEGIVTIADDEAGVVITRSTLNRNGLFLTSGLYDSGYKGAMAGALHNLGGVAKIEINARIGQFLIWKAEALHRYAGSYGIDPNGNIKNDEKVYHN